MKKLEKRTPIQLSLDLFVSLQQSFPSASPKELCQATINMMDVYNDETRNLVRLGKIIYTKLDQRVRKEASTLLSKSDPGHT